jgi:hypothetical protein
MSTACSVNSRPTYRGLKDSRCNYHPGPRNRQLIDSLTLRLASNACDGRLDGIEPAIELRAELRLGGGVPRTRMARIPHDLVRHCWCFQLGGWGRCEVELPPGTGQVRSCEHWCSLSHVVLARFGPSRPA